MTDKKRTKKSLLETLNVLEKCNFKNICLKDYFLGVVFQGKIDQVIKYAKINYDDEETRGIIVYQLKFPFAIIEVGI